MITAALTKPHELILPPRSGTVDRDSWNLCPLDPLFPCSDFVSRLGGGGVKFFSYFMLFTTFLEKNIWEYNFFLEKKIIYHLMFSSCFLCWKY